MKPYPIVVATRCTRSQGGSDRERKCLRSWWRNWRGACVARALKCVSILNVPTEPAKPNKCQWAKSLQRKVYTTAIFTGFYTAAALLLSRSLAHSLSLRSSSLTTDMRSLWAALGAYCLAYQFIIAHFIFIFNLCGKIHSRFVVVRVRLLPDVFVNIDEFWLIERALPSRLSRSYRK